MLTLTLPLLTTIAEESPAAPQGYSWDASLSRYRNLRTGRLVARTAIVNLLEHGVLDRERRLAAGTRALLDGRISPATWYARTAAMLKRQYYQNTALAAGGFDRLTADDVRWIEDRLQSEFGYLARFARQMAAGEVTEAQAANRMNMYVGHARQAYFKAERERLPRPERGNVIIERRILDARAENCEDCIGYQEMGWQREGVLPLPSEQSVCDGNCRCTLERQTVPEQEAGEWVGHGSRVGMAEYSPDQPRAPEGTPEGGQWVAAGSGELPTVDLSRYTHYIHRVNSQNTNLMLKPEMVRYLKDRGHSDDAIEQHFALLHAHGSVKSVQAQADADIIAAFKDPNSEVGAVLRDRAAMETALHDEWVRWRTHEGLEQFEKTLRAEWEDAFANAKYSPDMEEWGAILHGEYIPIANRAEGAWGNNGALSNVYRMFDDMKSQYIRPTVALYRRSSSGNVATHNLEAWSNRVERGIRGKAERRTWAELSKEYVILAGPGLMAGAPDESEVLLIRNDLLPASSAAEAYQEYSPDQPRAPEGTPEGGQWIPAGGGLSAATIDRPDSDARAERKQFDDKLARQAADIIGSGSIDSQYVPENFAPGEYSTFQLSMGILVDNEGAGIVKNHVAEEIAERAEISYDDANTLVKTWAKTSGGTNATSCQLQNVAAERFGVKEGIYDKSWLQTAALYGQPLVDRATTEKFINAVYDSTQAMLKGSGASTIRLYRGMEVEPDSALNKITDEIAVHASNPLSSWSLSPLTAHNFARRYGSSKPGVVLTLDVPVSRIWSTYLTGPGCLSEAEVIVIGGIDDQVRVQAREEFKWWLVEQAAPVAEYSPDQPRVPAGTPDGGQWTSANAAIIAVTLPKPPDTTITEVDRNWQRMREELELTETEFQHRTSLLGDALDKLQGQYPVVVYRREDDLERLAAGQELGTVHDLYAAKESGAAARSEYMRQRIEAETTLGIPSNAPPSARPIYGALASPESESTASHYGKVRIELRNEVKQRATLCQGDSFGTVVTMPFGATSYRALDPLAMGRESKYGVGDAPLKSAGTRVPGPLDLEYNRMYFEVQIYGGVRMADVRSVRFPRYKDVATQRRVEAALTNNKVEFTVLEE